MILLILILIGLLGGLVAGMLGVGGGIIFTPVLFILFDGNVENPVLWAIATSLLCTTAASAGSIRKHITMNNLFLKESVLTGIAGILGVSLGKFITLSEWYSRKEFAAFFSILLIYTAWSMFNRPKQASVNQKYDPSDSPFVTLPKALLIGGIGGVVAVLAGVGGGIVMVPIMTLMLGIHFRKAISISAFSILVISVSAWVQLSFETPISTSLSGVALGYVDFGTALPLIIGAISGAGIGTWLTGKINKERLQMAFGILSLLIAIRLIWVFFNG